LNYARVIIFFLAPKDRPLYIKSLMQIVEDFSARHLYLAPKEPDKSQPSHVTL